MFMEPAFCENIQRPRLVMPLFVDFQAIWVKSGFPLTWNDLPLSRKLAILAGVPLALARNVPGARFANSLILSDLTPPWRLVTLRSWVQAPLRPSSQKQWYLQCFFALQGCETQVKYTILRFSGYHSIWVGLVAFRYSMKKKNILGQGASSMMAVLASIWGAFFFRRV